MKNMTSAGLRVIDDRLGKEKEYWLEKLSGDLIVTGIPLDYERSGRFVNNKATVDFQLDPDTEAGLLRLCGAKDLLTFTVLLTALKICIHKYTGFEDIIVGSAKHERYKEEASLNKFLALRDRVAGTMTVKELLESIRLTLSEAYANQKYPFDRIIKLLKLEHSSNRAPLFNVVAILDSIHDRRNISHLKNDVTLMVSRVAGAIAVSIEYDPGLFKRATIELLAEHYQKILRGILDDPDVSISDLELLSEGKKEQLLFGFNGTQKDYPADKPICRLFEEQAAKTPEDEAVSFEGSYLSYAALNARSNQMAHYLMKLGVSPGVLVGLFMEHSLEMVVALMGVLKAGAAYVPLDPEHPRARLAYTVEDAQAPVLLTQQSLTDSLPSSTATVVCVDSDWGLIAQESEANPATQAGPHSTAYVIYTSGSTGQPKGVPISHRALVNYIWWARDVYLKNEQLAFALYSSLAFDLTVTSIFTPLVTGNKVVVYRRLGKEPPLDEILNNSQVGVLKLTPSHLSFVKERDNRQSRIRRLIVGGEALETKLALEVYKSFGGDVEIYNEYGPTEATVGCMIHLFDPDEDDRAFVPIGRPAANSQIYVLDSSLRPVAENVIGELYIAGDGLAQGYWRRPELTDQRFVANPFMDSLKMYKTGDLAKWLPEGVLEFIGRSDDQVKFHGFRIELNEVRSAINRHPEIRDSVVVVTKDQFGHDVMMAYYVSRHEIEVAQLRAFLSEHLMQETIPNVFVHLRKLPLTLNGKINHAALPTLQEARERIKRTYMAPRNPPEELLAGIWAGVLGLDKVGVYDNFFELGGDSILSIRIIARANRAGLHLTPKQLFQFQTVAELAELAGAIKSSPQAAQSAITGPVPLTPIQHWFFEKDLPDPHHYNQAILLEVRQRIDPAMLEAAVSRLLEYHDALRLRFTREDSGWVQTNAAPTDAAPVSFIDLSNTEEAGRLPALEEKAARLQASLNLSEGPLVRFALFDLGNESAPRLLIVAHHLVVDGISWRILLEDLQAILQQLDRGEPAALPPKGTSFQHWSRRLTEYADSLTSNDAACFISAAETGAGGLPVDYPGGANTVSAAATVSVSLGADETERLLRDVPRAYHSQINDVLLTALAQAFSLWTDETCLLVDLEGHGREDLFDEVELSRTVGWFTSIFPVRIDVAGMRHPADALKSVKEHLRAIPKRGIGYGLLRYLGKDKDLALKLEKLSGAQVAFNYLGQLDSEVPESSLFAPTGESVGPVRSPLGDRSHLIEIDGFVHAGRLQLRWTYSENLHRRATVERLAGYFLESVRSLIAHCLSPEAGGFTPSDFTLVKLTQAELDQVLDEASINGTVEDLYTLSPLQEGLLFHSLLSPQSGLYITQSVCTLEGLDLSAFKLAWQETMDRTPILRTAFVWKGLERPVQAVCSGVEAPLEIQDWRDATPADQESMLRSYLADDRGGGFDLSNAPLMRMALFQVTDTSYRFVWAHHHILLDGWSMYLVIKDVLASYDAHHRGDALRDEPGHPFRDYVAWLREQDLARAEAYWRKALNGVTAPMALQGGLASQGTPGGDQGYAKQQATLSAEMTASLQSLARQHRLTLNTIVQGAWALLLSRYSGEDEVLFGGVVSGRPAELTGIESMVGLFINTLPVRVQVQPGAPTVTWLKKVQEQQVEMSQYQYSPLVQIQKWSDVPHNMPLFESIFVFENYPIDPSVSRQSESVTVRDFYVLERTHFALSLAPGLRPELALPITYDAGRFPHATISRLLAHLRTLLESMVADINRRVSDLPSLTDVERHQLLVEWNSSHEDSRRFDCIHTLIERWAAATPDADAVIFDGKKLTYGDLNARADRVASGLIEKKIGRGCYVPVLMESGFDLVVSLHAIMKTGAAFVPLDTRWPAERLRPVLDDLGSGLIVVNKEMARKAEELGKDLFLVDGPVSAQPFPTTDAEVHSDDPIYAIFTSGSTGRPKAAIVAHRGITNRFMWMNEFLGSGPAVSTLQSTRHVYDSAIWELLWPLTNGGRTVIADPERGISAEHLTRLIEDYAVTVADFVPSVINQLIPQIVADDGIANRLRSLRELIVGGEEMTPEMIYRFMERFPGVRVLNLYGPTEASIGCLFYNVTGAEGGSIPIGRPMPNVCALILDKNMKPVPVGVPGEIYLGGVCVGLGYLNDEARTNAVFVKNPFDEVDSPLLYKTGDLARFRHDGNVEFLGRTDFQVKIRGIRVELGEIEAALKQIAGVSEALVVARGDGHTSKQLVAYLLTEAGGNLDVSDVRRLLRAQLPEYLVPSDFMLMDAWPLTAGGKIDRKALPDPSGLRPELEPAYVAPGTKMEKAIAVIWQEILHRESVGVHDNFFDLGGHSLLVIQLHGKLQNLLGRDVPLIDLFEYSTVSRLAGYLSNDGAKSLPEGDNSRAGKRAEGKTRLKKRLQNRHAVRRDEL